MKRAAVTAERVSGEQPRAGGVERADDYSFRLDHRQVNHSDFDLLQEAGLALLLYLGVSRM